MATEELQELQHRYEVALASYVASGLALSDGSEKKESLPTEVAKEEEAAFNELRDARQVFLRALHPHSRRAS